MCVPGPTFSNWRSRSAGQSDSARAVGSSGAVMSCAPCAMLAQHRGRVLYQPDDQTARQRLRGAARDGRANSTVTLGPAVRTAALAARFSRSDRELEALGATDDGDRHGRTDAVLSQQAEQVVDAAHWQFAEGDDQVALFEPGALGRAARLDRNDEHSRLSGQAKIAHHASQEWHRLTGDPDIAALHPAITDEPRRDELGGVDRDREADALRGLNDGSVDPNHLTPRVDQRATRIARIERRVGLNHVFDKPPRT